MRNMEAEEWEARQAPSDTLLHSILTTSPEAIVIVDEARKVRAFSTAAETMFGYSKGEVWGRNVSLLLPDAERSNYWNVPATGSTSQPQLPNDVGHRIHGMRKDGTVFAIGLHVGEYHMEGRLLFTAFMHDLSRQEDAEKKLHELQAELFRQSRIGIMSTMTTALAHEINQPLAAITNYVEAARTMMEPSLPFWDREEVVQSLQAASREAVRAGEIVSRLRRFISRGEMQRSLALPSDLVQQTCALATIEAKARGIKCSVEVASGEKPILVDPIQIQQVLLNLARNAIEATDSAAESREVRLTVEADDENVRFAVIDGGPGLLPGHVPFVPFSSTKQDGMGLGLSICKTIVEAHGGRIWHERCEPRGAAFKFNIPVARKEHDAA